MAKYKQRSEEVEGVLDSFLLFNAELTCGMIEKGMSDNMEEDQTMFLSEYGAGEMLDKIDKMIEISSSDYTMLSAHVEAARDSIDRYRKHQRRGKCS